jgi:hypothetical protein
MRSVGALLTGTIFALAFGACTFSPGPAGSAIGTPGSGASSGTAGTGFTGRAGSTGTGTSGGGGTEFGGDGPACGQKTYGTQNLPGDVLIIQDKSGSMANDFSDQPNVSATNPQKWASMVTALNNVVMNTQGNINWGLMFFPSGMNGGQCAVAGQIIAPAPNNAPAIAAAYAAAGNQPNGRTPTRLAVNNGATFIKGVADSNPKYILLATDGQPNCLGAQMANDDAGAIAAVMTAYGGGANGIAGIFVVGIGNVAASEATLNSMANAGGRAQMTPNVDPATGVGRVYYPADDATQLESALATISGQIKSCTFQLGAVPPDPTNIAVLGDNKVINKDPTNGWSYGAGMTSVVLNGTSCQGVMSGAIQQVSTIFGCPNMTIIVP